jgi:hypothetical protein|tara:strand:- start:13 stop:237 length:225 start_codon:yes stop_codon:yes gene_type:complete
MSWTKLQDGTYVNQANILFVKGDEDGSTITLSTLHTNGLCTLPWEIETDESLDSLMTRVLNDSDGVSAALRRIG